MDNRVRGFREKMDLTQEELAEKVKVTRQTIISIEQSRYDPSLPLAFKLSKVLKKKIDELFKFKEE